MRFSNSGLLKRANDYFLFKFSLLSNRYHCRPSGQMVSFCKYKSHMSIIKDTFSTPHGCLEARPSFRIGRNRGGNLSQPVLE